MTNTATTAAAQPPADDPADPAATDNTSAEPEPTSGQHSGENDDDHDDSPNAEAARYRVRLREVEAERDGLAERLAGYQRREVEAAVADVLDVPADMWDVAGADVASFYDDDGNLNTNDALGAAAALVDQRPRLAKQPDPGRSWGQHSAPMPPENTTDWSQVVNPRR